MSDRTRAVAALLDTSGIPHDGVTAAGPEGEVAAIRTEPAQCARIALLADGIRAIGFRFVTIDITSDAGVGTRRAT